MADIIVEKNKNTLVGIGIFKGYWDNGYPIITDTNGIDCAYPSDLVVMYKNITIPEGVQQSRYCYTEEKGFYENPDYEEPEEPDPTNTFGIPDEVYHTIKEQAVVEVQEGVINGLL